MDRKCQGREQLPATQGSTPRPEDVYTPFAALEPDYGDDDELASRVRAAGAIIDFWVASGITAGCEACRRGPRGEGHIAACRRRQTAWWEAFRREVRAAYEQAGAAADQAAGPERHFEETTGSKPEAVETRARGSSTITTNSKVKSCP